MSTLVTKTGIEVDIPDVRKIDETRPYLWLSQGWQDMRTSMFFSVGLGVLFTLTGYASLWLVWHDPMLVLGAISGFVLVAPFLAMGFYAVSRAHEQGRTPTLSEELLCWRGNAGSIALYAVGLVLVLIAWARLTSLVTAFAAFTLHTALPPSFEQLMETSEGWVFVGLYGGIGFVVAAAVFIGSVVSLPLMIDRKADPITALVTSVQAVRKNKGPMLVWAALIAGFIGIGMVTGLLGLIIIFPLLGHATWHAYRDLVAR